jgi:hypothetical protein
MAPALGAPTQLRTPIVVVAEATRRRALTAEVGAATRRPAPRVEAVAAAMRPAEAVVMRLVVVAATAEAADIDNGV